MTTTGAGTGTGTSAETGLGKSSGADTVNTGEDTGAKERAQQAASTAAEETKHVAGVAVDEAKAVAAETKDHARNLIGEARSQLQGQVDHQSRQQKDALAGTLSAFGGDLASMAENRSGLAADVVHEVAFRARSLSRHLDGREPSELLDDVRRFARRRPGTFLLGAMVAGVVVGRLARGTKDAIEAAEGTQGAQTGDSPHVTPGASDTSAVRASHVEPTQSPIPAGSPESAIGYASPPIGTGVATSPTSQSQGGPTA